MNCWAMSGGAQNRTADRAPPMSAYWSGVKQTSARRAPESDSVKGYGCRPSVRGGVRWGRRPEASRARIRGVEIAVLSLWGFDGPGWIALVAPMRLADRKA